MKLFLYAFEYKGAFLNFLKFKKRNFALKDPETQQRTNVQ